MFLRGICLLLILFLTETSFAQVSPHCTRASWTEPSISKGSFTQILTNELEAQAAYTAIYKDPRRLGDRAYWSEEDQSFVVQREGVTYKLPSIFIKSLTRHLEIALERTYAEYVFYPDLGHAHLVIPEELEKQNAIEPANFEDLLASPELKFLYHSAELFLLRDGFNGPLLGDMWWNWRYFSRNLLGDNRGGEDLHILIDKTNAGYNTVREIPGHNERARVYISANQNGCFSFRQNGLTVYFDLRME